jgi:hypothetical protein
MLTPQEKKRKVGKEEVMPDTVMTCTSDFKGPDHPFSDEDERERERERMRQLEPILAELEEWRKNSLSASFRV